MGKPAHKPDPRQPRPKDPSIGGTSHQHFALHRSSQPPFNLTSSPFHPRVQPQREARCYPPEREPRIVRDIYDCCRHYGGLRPKLQFCVFDSNKTLQLLSLDGVIPVTYRGVTYQIPVCIWCMPHYPDEAPVPYVRPTASMVIRERHSRVDKEGRVYLPNYLAVWDPAQFTFYGVVVAMIRVFSTEPPVNSRPTVAASSTEEAERRLLIANLSKRITDHLVRVNDEALAEIGQLLDKKEDIIKSDKHATEEMRAKATQLKASEDELQSLTNTHAELDAWVKSVGTVNDDQHIDDRLHHRTTLDEQMTQCSAEDGAYSDALDQLDEAFVKGVIDHDTYMKEIRRISREQFFPRALRRKISLMQAKQVDWQGTPRRVATSRIVPPPYASS